MKNKVALVHKQAEEKRAMVEARRGEEILKAEEMAAKYRATGQTPKKAFGCLGVKCLRKRMSAPFPLGDAV
ncbi:UNVERIFIED_CONTAM: Remorin [Sesamum latifolium]|uniref:Remorin n=1 Tax=Sesamum latifolium TaxID=2727402 RepID=A0AAW2YGL1_9LAMI